VLSLHPVHRSNARKAIGLLAGLGIVGSACTSLLGDFTSGGGQGTTDASTDVSQGDVTPGDTSPGSDSGAPSDGSTDVAPGDGAPPFTCTTWKWPQALVLDDSGHKLGDSIVAFQLGGGPLRVIVSKPGTVLFSVYTVNPTTQNVVQVDEPGPPGDNVLGIWRDRGSTAYQTNVVARDTGDSALGGNEVFPIPDTMNENGPIPSPFGLFAPTATGTVSSLTVTPFATNDIFEAVSVSTGSPATYTLGVARVSPTDDPTTLGAVATAVNSNQFSAPKLYRANNDVYIYNENDPSTPGSTGWAVPETAEIEGGITPQIIASGLPSGIVDMAPNSTAPSADILMYEEIKTGNITSGYNYRLGVIPNTNAGTWTSMNLPYIRQYTGSKGLSHVPEFSGQQWFWGDDILLMGQGFCIISNDGAPCTVFPGLNALWLNAETGLRAEEVGSNELLVDGGNNYFDVFTLPVSISATSAEWDVVYGQHMTSDAGVDYDVLYMNVLECQ
jgi:hypothetical protein